jgi:hypothetical protein
MFHVIVLGGIGLVGLGGCGKVASAGGGDGGTEPDATSHGDGFPAEGLMVMVDAFPSETAVEVDAFPSETGVQPDAFPMEGPAMLVDSGPVPQVDATVGEDAGCFPQETDVAFDAACPQIKR